MVRLYYSIWVDCIQRARSRSENLRDWKWKSLLFMTTAMCLNLLLVMVAVQELVSNRFYHLQIPAIPKLLSSVISFLVLFALPPLLLNHVLIFRNDRYKSLIERYPYRHSGKLFLAYFMVSLFLPLVLVWSGIIWHRWIPR